jgi:peroxiredoxin
MMNKNKLIIGFIIFIFIAAVYSSLSSGSASTEAPTVGSLAPDFALQSVSGKTVSLSDHRGKVVLINFWATWCPPCRQEMPHIQERYALYSPDFVVLSVNNGETAVEVESFVESFGLTFDPLLDPGADVSILYQITGYPTSVFVDREGVIRYIKVGFMSTSELDGYLASLGIDME